MNTLRIIATGLILTMCAAWAVARSATPGTTAQVDGKAIQNTPPAIIPGGDGLPPAVAQTLVKLRSSDSVMQREAAKAIAADPATYSALFGAVEEELLKGYKERRAGDLRQDSLSWLCNALGASKDRRFGPTLKLVAHHAAHSKVQKYARINYRKLR